MGEGGRGPKALQKLVAWLPLVLGPNQFLASFSLPNSGVRQIPPLPGSSSLHLGLCGPLWAFGLPVKEHNLGAGVGWGGKVQGSTGGVPAILERVQREPKGCLLQAIRWFLFPNPQMPEPMP